MLTALLLQSPFSYIHNRNTFLTNAFFLIAIDPELEQIFQTYIKAQKLNLLSITFPRIIKYLKFLYLTNSLNAFTLVINIFIF